MPRFKVPPEESDIWELDDAKARFGEVVRRARQEGPQKVTVRDGESVFVISSDELKRLTERPQQPLVPFLESLGLEDLPLEREPDTGRDLDL